MSDLARATQRLVSTATEGGTDAALRSAVNDVLEAFDVDDPKGAKAALALLDKGAAKAEGRAQQVLQLALGALVEAGAPPEAAWPAVVRGLPETLEAATSFAQACVKTSGDAVVDDAIEAVANEVAKKRPREALAWKTLASRCLAAVACLTRSRKLRVAEQKRGSLIEAVYPLEDAVEEVGFLSQVLRVLDDETLLVLHPETGRGFRVLVRDIATNVELFVLLTDAIVGDSKKGLLPGTRPDTRAVVALRDPESTPKKTPTVTTTFNLVAWTGLEADGTLPEADAEKPEHWIWIEGVPADIPAFKGERVVLLQDPATARTLPVEPSFSALRPEVRVKSKLSAAEVQKLLAAMAKAAAPKAKAKAKTKTKSKAKTKKAARA